MKHIAAMILVSTALVGCARQSDLDAANAKLVAANATIETATANLATANKTIDDLKAQLAAAQTQATELNARLSVKPRLPVTFAVRKQLLGPGLVLAINTTVKEPVIVLATVRNPALGTVKQTELHLNPSVPTFLSSAQGVPIDSGDEITLSNNNYSPSTFGVR